MIDHLVLATPDVPATAAEIRASWGIELAPGGSHVGRGTRNELTGLGGATYLEVVGPDPTQPDPALPRPFGVDDLPTASLVAWCARPRRALPDVLNAIAALGMDLGGAMEMSRARPDGVLLQWQLTFPLLGPPHLGVVPFLIDWLDSPHPALDLPHEATLASLHLTHPEADMVNAVLAEIGASSIIEVAEGPASLSAAVHTPRGPVTL
ncbi:MAG: VOC family protein [Actinobacteria bacterium]|nr:VOC family protein [Actinomycetota bacterium]